jgi:hypothetical protein
LGPFYFELPQIEAMATNDPSAKIGICVKNFFEKQSDHPLKG